MLITLLPVILVPVYHSTFCVMMPLSLEATRRLLMVLPPLMYISVLCLLQVFLKLFGVRYYHVHFFFLIVIWFIVGGVVF